MSKRTWPEMLAHVPRIVFNHEIDLLCGYLCYTTLLSLIPMIVLFLIVGSWFGAHDHDTHLLADRLIDLLTPESAEKMKSAFAELLANMRVKRLGLSFTLPLLVVMFVKLRMVRTSFMNLLKEHSALPWVADMLLFVLMLGIFPLLFSFFDAVVLSQIPKVTFFSISKLLVMQVSLMFLFWQFLPGHTPWRRIFWGAALGCLVLTIGNHFFTQLTTQVFQINRLYGAFASIPIFLIWIYFFWMTLVTCIVLCSDHWRSIGARGE